MKKYYLFRELGHKANLENGRSFNASGLAELINENSESGKDLACTYINPFTLSLEYYWLSTNEVELFDVEDYEIQELLKFYENISLWQ